MKRDLEVSRESNLSEVEARRRFLKNCAKFAAGMPPAVTLLLQAARASAQEEDPVILEMEEAALVPDDPPPGCSLGAPPLPDPNPSCDP